MQCADCRAELKEGATRCRSCGSRATLEAAPDAELGEAPLPRPASRRLLAQVPPCRRCGRPATPGSLLAFCPDCRRELDQESGEGPIQAAWTGLPESMRYGLATVLGLLLVLFGMYVVGRAYRDRDQKGAFKLYGSAPPSSPPARSPPVQRWDGGGAARSAPNDPGLELDEDE